MHYVNPLAATVIECLDAVRLTGDPARLHEAPAAELVNAVAVCAKALVRVAEKTGHLGEQRNSAFHVVNRASSLLRQELRRRGQPNVDR
jgi:hypothetical protein